MKKKERKNSFLLVTGSVISKMGDLLFDYANKVFLASINLNSTKLVGMYQLLDNLIAVVFNLFGGVIADQFKRKKIIIITDFINGITCIFMSFIRVNEWLVVAIIGLNILISTLSAFTSPSYKSITKEVVKKENLSKINSKLRTGAMVVKIIAPVISISIYNILGIRGVLMLNGCSFIFAGILTCFIVPIVGNFSYNSEFKVHYIFKDLKSGYLYLSSRKKIYMLILFASFVNFFLAGYELVLPFSKQMFPNTIDNIYGTLIFAQAIGGTFGAMLSGKINIELSTYKLMNLLALSGISLIFAPIIYIFSYNAILISLSPAMHGFFLTMFNVQFFSIVQSEIETTYLGRVFGIIYTMALAFMPIGTIFFTNILSTSFSYNLVIIGLSIVLLSITFNMIYVKSKVE